MKKVRAEKRVFLFFFLFFLSAILIIYRKILYSHEIKCYNIA